jgi:hypothetical protein
LPPPDLSVAAAAVLRRHDAGSFTRPSAAQYPHQWNWDSAFISLGWSHLDWARACLEIESMLRGRWRNGMVPHLRYDSSAPAGYFPGPDWWPGAAVHVAEPGQLTSGITNPPILVSAARLVGERAPSEPERLDFWRRVLPSLTGFVRYFPEHRRLPGSRLFAMVHPWESGWDNSPRWDLLRGLGLRPSRPYQRLDQVHVTASQRPTEKDYDAFLALAELWDASGYNVQVYASRSPFVVHDVLLDALWYRAAVDLNLMARAAGLEAPIPEDELAAYSLAFEGTHRDPATGAYFDFDILSGRRLAVATAAGPAGLAGGVSPVASALEAWKVYARQIQGVRPVPTVPPSAPEFDPVRYWRGPVWVNVNWLICSGLSRYGLDAEAEHIRSATLELVAESGIAEYFDPISGAGHGAVPFSWTAALCLEMFQKKGKSA